MYSLVWDVAAKIADVSLKQDIPVLIFLNSIKNSTSLPQQNQNLNQTTNS